MFLEYQVIMFEKGYALSTPLFSFVLECNKEITVDLSLRSVLTLIYWVELYRKEKRAEALSDASKEVDGCVFVSRDRNAAQYHDTEMDNTYFENVT